MLQNSMSLFSVNMKENKMTELEKAYELRDATLEKLLSEAIHYEMLFSLPQSRLANAASAYAQAVHELEKLSDGR